MSRVMWYLVLCERGQADKVHSRLLHGLLSLVLLYRVAIDPPIMPQQVPLPGQAAGFTGLTTRVSPSGSREERRLLRDTATSAQQNVNPFKPLPSLDRVSYH